MIGQKNVNYKDIFNRANDQTNVYKDSFYGAENSIFERNNTKSMAILNSTLSKKEPNFIYNKDNMKEIKMIKTYIQQISDIIAKYEVGKNGSKLPVVRSFKVLTEGDQLDWNSDWG